GWRLSRLLSPREGPRTRSGSLGRVQRIPLVLACCVSSCQAPPALPLDGRPFVPVIRAIEGTTERPAPGDLAWTGELWVVLDDAGPHAWVNEPAGDGHHGARVWSLADGRRRLVGLRVHDAAHVEDLDDVDWRSLRGIEFEVWTDELAGLLAR